LIARSLNFCASFLASSLQYILDWLKSSNINCAIFSLACKWLLPGTETKQIQDNKTDYYIVGKNMQIIAFTEILSSKLLLSCAKFDSK
jgi:hypothetical protein